MRLLGVLLSLSFLILIGAGDDRAKIQSFREAWEAAGDDLERQVDAARDLEGTDSPAAARILLQILEVPQVPFDLEDVVMEILSAMRSEGVVKLLGKEVQSNPKWQTRILVARCLKLIQDPGALPGLHKAMKDKRWAVRSAAIGAIASIRSKESIEPLIQRLAKEDGRIAGEIRNALRRITQEELDHCEEWKIWWNRVKDTFEVPPETSRRRRPEEPEETLKTQTLYGTVVSERVIFVVDISESMKVVLTKGPDRGLSRLQIMKRELVKTILYALPEKAEFNIIAYATDVMPWKKKMIESTQENRNEACAWVDDLELSGETNIMGALELALSDRKVDTIYFLSDGSPSVGRLTKIHDILAEVHRMNGARSVAIHTIALLGGDGKVYKLLEHKPLAREFLQKLAEKNDGTYKAFE